MKKNHIINQLTGKTFCGINSDNQLIAFNHEGDWFDSTVHPIDHTNYKEMLCVNCMKQFDMQLIEKFEMDAFLIDYSNRLPKTGRAMKFFKSQSRRKRQSIDRSAPISKPAEKSNQSIKSKSSNKKKQIKPAVNQSIPKSDKGKKRAERKANQSKATDNKCVVIDKPKQQLKDKPKDDIIILKESDMIKDKPINQSKTKEVIVDVDPSDDWAIGDPIDKDIFEMAIGDDWKIIRHSKKLNQWKFVNRKVVKGIPKWIDESNEWIDYKEISQLIIDGYCE